MRLPYVLKQFVVQSALWASLCLIAEMVCGLLLHLRYPYDYPAGRRQEIFCDFSSYIEKFRFFHRARFYDIGPPLTYPAATVVLFKPFLLIIPSHHSTWIPTICYIATILFISWALLIVLGRSLIVRGLAPRAASFFVCATYFSSFAFWFEVHQGNIEFFVWLTTTAALWAFWTRRTWTAALFLGLAISMKIFPAVYLLLLLSRKQYRQAALSIFVAALNTVFSLWLVCPDIVVSWRGTSAAVAVFHTYMLRLFLIETGFDHSLFALFKRLLPTLPPPEQVDHLLTLYLVFATLTGLIVYFLRLRKLPVANQLLCLTVASILLPPISFDYTLLHLYAPFVLLVFVALERARSEAPRTSNRDLLLGFSLFAFALSFQSEFIVHGLRFSGQLKAVALLLLAFVSLICPFPMDEDRISSEAAIAEEPDRKALVFNLR